MKEMYDDLNAGRKLIHMFVVALCLLPLAAVAMDEFVVRDMRVEGL